MILNVLYAVADDISYVDRRINSLCVSASEAFEKGFVFNTLWIVEIAFLIIYRHRFKFKFHVVQIVVQFNLL